jgi:hypothetical protein
VARAARSTRELCKASDRVAYEIELLYGTLNDLGALLRARYGGADPSPWTRDALIESWTIHVRNMMHFLRGEKAQRGDILARDFFTGTEWQKLLPRRPRDDAEKHIERRINKEIVHLTFAGAKVTRERKQWQLHAITAKVGDELQVFIDHVPMNRVDPSFHRRALDTLKTFHS